MNIWVFLIANISLFVISGLLMVLSYIAYRQRPGNRSFAISAAGFGCIVVAALIDPVYLFVISPDYSLTSTESLLLRSGEAGGQALGLGLLFYAIVQHDSDISEVDVTATLAGEDDQWPVDQLDDD